MMPEFEHLQITRRGRVATIAFDRPDKLNAFNARMHGELPHAITGLAFDPDCDVIVMTGNGRAFSAGGDVDWQEQAMARPELFDLTMREAKQIIFAMLDCDKPIIARINGPAVGLGATLAVMCDISFIARSTYIADPHVSMAMVAGDGGALIWPQLIGFARAKHYLFTGDRIGAEEAERIGLVSFAVDDDGLDAAVNAYADRLVSGAQLAIRYTKTTINVALRQLATAVLDAGLAYEGMTNLSDDHREAVAAFAEKRPPRYGQARTGA